jgi:hypothetical protein
MAIEEDDFNCTDDIDARLSNVDERTALLQALYRRLRQRTRGLFYDLTYGENIEDYLSAGIDDPSRYAIRIANECRKEDKVNEVSVIANRVSDEEWSFIVEVDSQFGTFEFTIPEPGV